MTEDLRFMIIGGPLFRKPGTTLEEFSKSWHRHAEVVLPWFLEFGIIEYTQIHLHLPSNSTVTAEDSGQQHVQDPDILNALEILRQADGVAFVKCLPLSTASGVKLPLGSGLKHPYFSDVIAIDERTFLHPESGASAIKSSATLPNLPEIAGGATTWRRLALKSGGQEYVKIQGGTQVIDNVWWDEWKKLMEV